MSNPFPMLFRFDGRPCPGIPSSLIAPLLAAIRRVERATQYRAWFNAVRGSVIWIADDPERGGAEEEIVFDRGNYLPIDADRTCRRLMRAMVPWETKMRQVERKRRDDKDKVAAFAQNRAEDIAEEFQKRARHMVRVIEDGRMSRPIVTVP